MQKQIILTSKQCAENPFPGQSTQHPQVKLLDLNSDLDQIKVRAVKMMMICYYDKKFGKK